MYAVFLSEKKIARGRQNWNNSIMGEGQGLFTQFYGCSHLGGLEACSLANILVLSCQTCIVISGVVYEPLLKAHMYIAEQKSFLLQLACKDSKLLPLSIYITQWRSFKLTLSVLTCTCIYYCFFQGRGGVDNFQGGANVSPHASIPTRTLHVMYVVCY